MKWQVGDVVQVIFSPGQPQFIGEITTVIGIHKDWVHPFEVNLGVDECGGWRYSASSLKRIDDYDGNQASTWDETTFKPKDLVTCE